MARNLPPLLARFIKLSLYSLPIIICFVAAALVEGRYEYGECEITSGKLSSETCDEKYEVIFTAFSKKTTFPASVTIKHQPPSQAKGCENKLSKKTGRTARCYFRKSDAKKEIIFHYPIDGLVMKIISYTVYILLWFFVSKHMIMFIFQSWVSCTAVWDRRIRPSNRNRIRHRRSPQIDNTRHVLVPPPVALPRKHQGIASLPPPTDHGLYARKLFNDGWMCSICLDAPESFAQVHNLKTLECHHAFHAECINDWEKKGGDTCPLCRRARGDSN